MQVVILAGGRGRRMGEHTANMPKPLVQIGGRPVLWHILMHFRHYGFDDFLIATGYRGDMIADYVAHCGIDARIRAVDTGVDTASGGRVLRLMPLLLPRSFMMTWADGVADIDLGQLAAFHRAHGLQATVTAVHPPPRFGRLILEGEHVTRFAEKTVDHDVWINGAYFVLEPSVARYIDGDDTAWEGAPMERLVAAGQLKAFRHEGFWRCADTVHEFELLDTLWRSGAAPWRISDS